MQIEKALLIATIAGTSFYAMPDHALSEQQRLFEVETWIADIRNDMREIYPNAKFHGVVPVGRGTPEDIQCEGESDERGKLNCRVESCDIDDELRTIYNLEFSVPSSFFHESATRVRIRKCTILDEQPIVARFVETSFLAAQIDNDIHDIFGDLAAVARGTMISEFSADDYIREISALANEPFGELRVMGVRRAVQDAGQIAVQNDDPRSAAAYSELAIAHAGWLMGNIYEAAGLTVETSRPITNLTRFNAIFADLLSAEVGSPPDDVPMEAETMPILIPYLDIAEPSLRLIFENTSRGILANQEFQQLEAASSAAAVMRSEWAQFP